MEKPFNTLGIADIMRLNKEVIDRFGGLYTSGNDNFHNKASLEYVLESVIFPLFGEELYKDCFEKIAAIARAIIVEHVFHDGNKRTALAVIIGILAMNGYGFIPSEDDENFLVGMAENKTELAQIADWMRKKAFLKYF